MPPVIPPLTKEQADILGKLLSQTTEVRLISAKKEKTNHPGIFTAANAKKNEKTLVELKNPAAPLITVRTMKDAGQDVDFLSLTPLGIRAILEDQHRKGIPLLAIDQIAIPYRADVAAALDAIQTAQVEAVQVELRQHRQKQQQLADQFVQGLQFLAAEITQSQKQLESMQQSLQQLEAKRPKVVDTPPPKTPAALPQVARASTQPRDESDLDFQRDLAQELVFAWQDSSVEETTLQFERVLDNLPGVTRVGEPDEATQFDGRHHESEDLLQPGDSIMIVTSGWQLNNIRGVKLLAKAKVRKL